MNNVDFARFGYGKNKWVIILHIYQWFNQNKAETDNNRNSFGGKVAYS